MVITIRFEDRALRFKIQPTERSVDVAKRAKHAFEVRGLYLLRTAEKRNMMLSETMVAVEDGAVFDLIKPKVTAEHTEEPD